MKIEMLNDYGGLKKGRIYEIKESTGLYLIESGKASNPIKFFVKGKEETKQDVIDPVKQKRTRKKK